MHVTVVTITNGHRWHLLQQTVVAAFAAGADRAVVVDNESEDPITDLMAEAFPGRHVTVRLWQNQGSAGAYYEGIRRAVEDGAEFILLLDDDNAPRPNAIASLKTTYRLLGGDGAQDRLCLAALRPVQEALRGDVPEPSFPSEDEFLGFHVRILPRALWKRRPWAKQSERRSAFVAPQAPIRRTIAAWGGLFFHRALIERFGYPDRRLVLYGDDVEFTHRIPAGGGELWLDPNADIDDLEASWLSDHTRESYLHAWLRRGSDEQIYYHTRNLAYLETHQRKCSWMREINRATLVILLWSISVRAKTWGRFRLIVRAAADGEKGVLGRFVRECPANTK